MAAPEGHVGRRLILVRHSVPEVAPDVSAREWRLSTEGRQRAAALAGRLATAQDTVAAVVSSVEPKAAETAAILAEAWGRPYETVEGLHEHDRSNVGWMSRERFEAAVTDFFRRPKELVLGRETAAEALARVERAVAGVLAKHPRGDLVIVTHGTVMTLFVAATNPLDAVAFWHGLALPDAVILAPPGRTLLPHLKQERDWATSP